MATRQLTLTQWSAVTPFDMKEEDGLRKQKKTFVKPWGIFCWSFRWEQGVFHISWRTSRSEDIVPRKKTTLENETLDKKYQRFNMKTKLQFLFGKLMYSDPLWPNQKVTYPNGEKPTFSGPHYRSHEMVLHKSNVKFSWTPRKPCGKILVVYQPKKIQQGVASRKGLNIEEMHTANLNVQAMNPIDFSFIKPC